ncbi:HAMP domain-containing sensor histidine kinase [Brevibacillus choshinensis]|uniref:HAMP domain-containing sensor histidine kinase n=1 Tax=Brevibacillus choshinensis TaxID=54911 RepID=UPI002E1AEF69|nr:HAMP domain-containing sensor histidine kinase [Brevibacillus choshinensis]
MRDKPFGLQIWVIMTAFLIFITGIITVVLVSYVSVDVLINLIRLLVILSIVNICIAKFISTKITEPLRNLEKKVRKIASKEWEDPIFLDRGDEFGKLASSINMMQESLKKMEMEEEVFLQSVSHDLKTPIMVIHSYSQALADKVYLNDSFEETVAVIIKEAKSLEKKVEKLLYLNSLDYILERTSEFKQLNIKTVLENLVERFSMVHGRVTIQPDLVDLYVWGNEEELTVALENILENNMRYAATTIWITASVVWEHAKERVEILLENDGPPIEVGSFDQLFNHFYKGKNGKFGLGLFITKKIIQFHGGEVNAENKGSRVAFKISLPQVAK